MSPVAENAAAPEQGSGGTRIDLTLLATSDLHAHLFPFNYYVDQRDDRTGLVQTAHVIDAARRTATNALLFDNGDLLQGAPLGDAAISDPILCDKTHPMIAALNALGVDAATLGNHDFDYGLEVLERVLGQVQHPVILANARYADGTALAPDHVVLERTLTDRAGQNHPFRIGVIGLAPPQTAKWHKLSLGDRLVWEDMVAATRRVLDGMDHTRVDAVVLLAHSGLGLHPAPPGAENAARALAALPGVDAVVSGHTHEVIPIVPVVDPTGAATPIVQPGALGTHLGKITLGFEMRTDMRDGSSVWQRVESCAETVPIPDAGAASDAALRGTLRRHPVFRAQLRTAHRRTRSYAARVLGRTEIPLTTYFALAAPSAALTLMAEAKLWAIGDQIADDPSLAGLPVAVAVAPFKAGGRGGADNYTDVPRGPLQLRHAADLYAYANTMAVLRVGGADVRAWLERTAAAFQTIDPSRRADTQDLLAPGFASYNFDVFYGLDYQFDLTQAALTNAEGDAVFDGPGRVRDLRLQDGTPLADDQDILVVTNSYRAGGGGHFPAAARGETVLQTTTPVRDALAAYIEAATSPLAPKPRRVWAFADLGGVPVTFASGPGSKDHAPKDLDHRFEDLGVAADGFRRWRMRI